MSATSAKPVQQELKPCQRLICSLCTVDGERIVHKSELEPGHYYVAVGFRAPFKRLNYGQMNYKPPFQVTPRVDRSRYA